ncbi:hypothetical protein FPH17_04590 [Corynebacterium godavarianum]|uniref:Transmembrane protein n=1 Tax=Corynebacterium godavarianum TaxID=2054421 RepID=A0ABY3E7J3_9CORY|nr:gephyrin-like molybdotransferase receptor GlpR [Corynebacterium godavarianum]MBL7285471.1 hypothetical protein [Corynebacterium godavarianum]TSJ75665.1 hypothetical protein FPH17_04590 [Corynebacterium godavarianum]
MGSPSLILVLILVVWVIVLAPMMLGSTKKIRRSGEGYEETRVLHEGGTEPVVARRRPKLTPADVHHHTAAEDDVELVETEEEQVLIDDTPTLRNFFRKEVATQEDRPVVIDAEPEDEEAGSTVVDLDEKGDEEPQGGSTVVETDAEADRYEMSESYGAPSDFGYAPEGSEDSQDSGDSATAEAAPESEPEPDFEPDDSDLEFAKTRRGRGGYDPERERTAKADRFQRRQRTLLVLIASFVVTFVVAFVVGGWTWVLPAITAGLTAWFLIVLRGVVKKERALHERRVRQLRRARLGVDVDRPQPTPRERRRVGSVILDLDEEHPDFDALPGYVRPQPREDGYGEYTPRAS